MQLTQSPTHSDTSGVHRRVGVSRTSASGTRGVLLRVKEGVMHHNIALMAAGVAFFGMLALFPALIAAISLYGLLASPDQAQHLVSQLSAVLPEQARTLLLRQLAAITSRVPETLSWSAALALLLALYSASSGTHKLIEAIGLAYEQREARGYIKQRGVALLLTLGFIVAAVVAFGVVAVLPALLPNLGLHHPGESIIAYGRWPFLALCWLVGVGVLYAVAPYGERPLFRWLSWGSLLSTALWIAASFGLSLYAQHFSTLGATYGSLAGVVVLMLWIFIAPLAVLLGAELNAAIEAQSQQDAAAESTHPNRDAR